MARTTQEIDTELAQAQAGYPALAALTSPSATALHRLWRFVLATCAQTLETLWDRHRTDVDAIVARAAVGTAGWYADRAKEFQENDATLAVQANGAIGYLTANPAARIVARATAKENAQSGKLFIKVARTGNVPGTLAAIVDGPQPGDPKPFTELKAYFDRIRFAGTRLEVVSREADRLQVSGVIFYDPLREVAAVRQAVLAAATAHLAGLAFDGQVYVSRLTDALQAVPGVRDVAPLELAARVGGLAPVDFGRVYETVAGYIILEDLPGAGLLDTLTFLPDGQ